MEVDQRRSIRGELTYGGRSDESLLMEVDQTRARKLNRRCILKWRRRCILEWWDWKERPSYPLAEKKMYVDVDKLTEDNRWSENLPDNLVEMVMKRLSLVDSIRYVAVCTSWRSVSSQWFQRATRISWLMRAVNVTPHSGCSSKRWSVDGWLIMTEFSRPYVLRNYFFNPMTGARLMLPPLEGAIPWDSVAYSDPNCSDCIVACSNYI
ncbi:hypothetical protein M0R45_029614 [Rubus argutus]|uniref:F-box domain-containing protein n=1 Tax=Rubus argutus TaxID=59490 RepID=A0AAW1WAP1_RUBAR